jgi:hypothetical protein
MLFWVTYYIVVQRCLGRVCAHGFLSNSGAEDGGFWAPWLGDTIDH